MNNNTKAKKVTLRPTQIKKVLRVAKKDYDGNFSLALRVMVDKFEEEAVFVNPYKELAAAPVFIDNKEEE